MKEKNTHAKPRQPRFKFLYPTDLSYLTLEKLLDLSVPWFPLS